MARFSPPKYDSSSLVNPTTGRNAYSRATQQTKCEGCALRYAIKTAMVVDRATGKRREAAVCSECIKKAA